MTTVGVDIEQFVVDPYGSGIQRVLQYLAKQWPQDLAQGAFVIPRGEDVWLLDPEQAAELISLAFAPQRSEDLRIDVNAHLGKLQDSVHRVPSRQLAAEVDAWLLPEVSYLPSVLTRFEELAGAVPTGMIGYDALPMTEPANYRFPPGTAANASEYFRLLASADALVCISEYSREAISVRLRRNPELATTVAHPGGDHVPAVSGERVQGKGPVHFLRLGTMETRKSPLEILRAFLAIRASGVDARLTYVGVRSSSYEWINEELRAATASNVGFTWITDASDDDVAGLMAECDALLSFGTEGYGIPVLEAIRRGLPVLYGGIQPAAELLEGAGAVDCGPPSELGLKQVLTRFAEPTEINKLTHQVDPARVPRWSDFARTTVATVLGSLDSDLSDPVPRGR